MMLIGLALPHYPFSFPGPAEESTAQQALSYAKLAEDVGFHRVWVSDHLFVNVAPPGQEPVIRGRAMPKGRRLRRRGGGTRVRRRR